MDTKNCIKKLIAGFLGMCIIAVVVGITFHFAFRLDYCCSFLNGILGMLGQFVITFCFKGILWYRTQNYTGKGSDLANRSHFSHCKKYVWMVLSFDHVIADYFKDKLPKYARSYYITSSNTFNLLVSFLLTILVFVLVSLLCEFRCFVIFLCAVVFARFLSRTMEINLAFFIDIFSSQKRSSLTKNKRIMLAIKSLAEEAFLFAAVYFMFAKNPATCNTIIESILNGLRSFTLNGSSDCYENFVLLKILSTYQGISAIILLTLSVASYISSGSPNEKNTVFDLLCMKNPLGTKEFVTNTSESYLEEKYTIHYSKDGYVEYVVSKSAPEKAIITRILYKNDELDFSEYVREIKEQFENATMTISLANGALKTAVGTRKVYVPAEMDFLSCSFAHLFTIRQVVLEKPVSFSLRTYFHRCTRVFDGNRKKLKGYTVRK